MPLKQEYLDYIRTAAGGMSRADFEAHLAAWRAGFIDDTQLRALAEPLTKSGYGDYLLNLLEWAN